MSTTKSKPACIRCGMCCIAGSCGIGDEDELGICKELIVHKDLTTSCRIIDKTTFKGSGCNIRGFVPLRKAYEEYYRIDDAKREIRKLRSPIGRSKLWVILKLHGIKAFLQQTKGRHQSQKSTK